MRKVLLGAGCFWGVQEYFRKIEGVILTEVGYSGGNTPNPTYEEVCKGNTKHAEVVRMLIDENIIKFDGIINHFWKCHDPTQLNRQGFDIGDQYRSVIFYYNEEQQKIIENSKMYYQSTNNKKIATLIEKATDFYLAEEYHQRYILKKNLLK